MVCVCMRVMQQRCEGELCVREYQVDGAILYRSPILQCWLNRNRMKSISFNSILHSVASAL